MKNHRLSAKLSASEGTKRTPAMLNCRLEGIRNGISWGMR
nr:MAG TPA: hypothetical protein [Caudoviricetes sp.]